MIEDCKKLFSALREQEIIYIARNLFHKLSDQAKTYLIQEIKRRQINGVAGIAISPDKIREQYNRDIEEEPLNKQFQTSYKEISIDDEELRDIMVRIIEDR